ncbi:Protein psi1 AltName: Full=Protein psi [Serendipita indica DSM 11827]|uniref:Related to DNAJ-like protein Psi n=1 Tax=Serendipita indica (strain DSM 11827) TaxID=1109443 RepID=G4TKF7_SERID|nr:Protein psi1 AltName: Full=Protein psi [Serendipita indica DSM 11827]CCA71805.1 related to DNAJ-like protein Psi [Serendipita indica DSM 11827]
MGKNYYDILGVDKNADDDAIKKAYKKQALKWHPDRNAGSEAASAKFKEVSEAFEVLSDKNKRAVYDQFGEEGLKGAPPPDAGGTGGFSGFPGAGGAGFGSGGFPGGATFTFTSGPGGGSRGGYHPSDPNSIFEQFFKSFSMGGGMGPGSHRAAFGDDDDDPMMGSGMPGGFFNMGGAGMGGMPGGGPGARTKRPTRKAPTEPSQPNEVVRPLKVKLEDLATGVTKKLKVTRRLLTGEQVEKTLEIVIHPGYKAGTKFRFKGEGNEREGAEPQDLVFELEEIPHDRFTRDGNDLIITEKLSLLEALAGNGGNRQIVAIDGRRPSIAVPASIVKPGTQTRVPGYGMPIRKEGQIKSYGDLIVKWDIVFPDRLTSGQKEGLRKVLG